MPLRFVTGEQLFRAFLNERRAQHVVDLRLHIVEIVAHLVGDFGRYGHFLRRRRLRDIRPVHSGLQAPLGDECRSAVAGLAIHPCDIGRVGRALEQPFYDARVFARRVMDSAVYFGVERCNRRGIGRHGDRRSIRFDLQFERRIAFLRESAFRLVARKERLDLLADRAALAGAAAHRTANLAPLLLESLLDLLDLLGRHAQFPERRFYRLDDLFLRFDPLGQHFELVVDVLAEQFHALAIHIRELPAVGQFEFLEFECHVFQFLI